MKTSETQIKKRNGQKNIFLGNWKIWFLHKNSNNNILQGLGCCYCLSCSEYILLKGCNMNPLGQLSVCFCLYCYLYHRHGYHSWSKWSGRLNLRLMLHTYILMQSNIFNSVSNVHHHICALFDLVHLYCAYEAFDTWFSVG